MKGEPLGSRTWLMLGGFLILPFVAGFRLSVGGWVVPTLLLVMSVVAWFLYRTDKKAATLGNSRISENTLHGVELLGGWPGAFLAQRWFRHKTRKLSFRTIFWGIVFLHQVVALEVVTGGWLSKEFLRLF